MKKTTNISIIAKNKRSRFSSGQAPQSRSGLPRFARNDKSNPLVSVIMPVYNAEKYVAEAIKSIVNQTYPNFELIVVDDASTDNSWKIVARYQKKYPKIIKAIHLTKNLNSGGDSCANVAYRAAQGTYIARMDADDIAHKERLAIQVAYLQQNPEVLMVGSQAYVINKNGKTIGTKSVPTTHAEIYKQYAVFHPMIHPTVMFNRALLPKSRDLYKIKYSANNDLYTFFQFLHSGKFANLEDKLLFYRVHGKNDSLTEPKNRFFNTLKIRLGAIQQFGYRPTPKSIVMTSIQAVAIFILPEAVIVPLYLYMKGISKPKTFVMLSQAKHLAKRIFNGLRPRFFTTFRMTVKSSPVSLRRGFSYLTQIFL